jgi:hypothetical protein
MEEDSPVHLAIVGYRNYNDYDSFSSIVDEYILRTPVPACIISGGCVGVDKMAERYAEEYSIPMDVLKPNRSLGNRGFAIRDREIAKKCTHMLAFPSVKGKGTQLTIGFAQKLDKPVEIHWV